VAGGVQTTLTSPIDSSNFRAHSDAYRRGALTNYFLLARTR
jgi:hypothetical protein